MVGVRQGNGWLLCNFLFQGNYKGAVWLFSCLLLFGLVVVVVEVILTIISSEQDLL